MRNIFLISLLFSFFPPLVQAQQVNEYLTCTKYKEVYTPGFYDNYGRYVQGSVSTQAYRTNCGTGAVIGPTNPTSYQQPYVAPRPYYNNGYYGRGTYCDPTRSALGALLGGGVAASMSRGNGYYWSVPVGAAVGGAIFGCN